ncbi:MAG: hypothetical protein QM763_13875 [Agriterribacter sp.]
MKTLGASFSEETCLLINGVSGKIVTEDSVEPGTQKQLTEVLQHLQKQL